MYRLSQKLAGVVLAGAVVLGTAAGAGAERVGAAGLDVPVDLPTASVCRPVYGHQTACLTLAKDAAGNSTARACIYDEALRIVAWWYVSSGDIGCMSTHHWSFLGVPGACAGTGATGRPTACVNQQKSFDDDRDGVTDETLECLVWVAGSAWCFDPS